MVKTGVFRTSIRSSITSTDGLGGGDGRRVVAHLGEVLGDVGQQREAPHPLEHKGGRPKYY
ncbi:hypothetical protein TYRP_015245 [Tyrophagus putrescentiae]|nr:hypothetical protein TYRP_015245 [Tyrophagus putrescentiae]